ncbi:hypothetical protein [Streptomyces cinereoruber]|uniref:hypothetical protein n=1 Tax=Streptomyces cinereoruber TaxID=67260 RepID=UPI003C2DC89F
MKLSIIWEEPPEQGGHDLIAKTLRVQPGRWARIERPYKPKSAGAIARSVRLGRLSAYAPAGDFDAASCVYGDVAYVYVRFLGDGVSDE